MEPEFAADLPIDSAGGRGVGCGRYLPQLLNTSAP